MYRYYFDNLLDNSEKKIYMALLNGFEKMDSEIKFKYMGNVNISKIFTYIMYDNPNLYFTDTCKYVLDLDSNTYTVKPKYTMNRIRRIIADKELSHIINRIISKISDISKWKTLLNLHDYLCQNMKYRDENMYSHSIYFPLLYNKGVCDGFSYVFKYICDYLGINSMVISGEIIDKENCKYEKHMWNKVQIMNDWYNIDITSDLCGSYHKVVNHRYFLVPDVELKINYIQDNDIKILCTSNKLAYFNINKVGLNSDNQVIDFIVENLNKKNYTFEILLNYIKEENELKEVLSRCFDTIVLLNEISLNYYTYNIKYAKNAIISIKINK